MIDCHQVSGHWVALFLSVILFNVGIAIASFATTKGSQGWRIVGVTLLSIGVLMLVTIPLLIRRSVQGRMREAFRSLPESELRRKRCHGHYIAWMLSALHFVLGIALTSYAADIESNGWTVVGIILMFVGLVLMVSTTIVIYSNLRDRRCKLIQPYTEQRDTLVSKNTTSFIGTKESGNEYVQISNGTANGTANGNVGVLAESSYAARDRKSTSAPDIYDDVSVSIQQLHNHKEQSKRLALSLPDITGLSLPNISVPSIADIKKEEIEHLSMMMDHDVPNWNTFAHKIASNNKNKLKKYDDFVLRIDHCGILPFGGEDSPAVRLFSDIKVKYPALRVKSILEIARIHDRNDIVDYISANDILQTERGDDRRLNDISFSATEALVRLLDRHVKENWISFAKSLNFTDDDISDIQLALKPQNQLSPTSTLFDLLKAELPELTLKEMYDALKDIGRNDVANYLERTFLSH